MSPAYLASDSTRRRRSSTGISFGQAGKTSRPQMQVHGKRHGRPTFAENSTVLKQRIVTAIFFVAAMLGGILGGKVSFYLLFSAVAVGCLWEFATLLLSHDERHFNIRRWWVVLSGSLPVLLWGWACLTAPSMSAWTNRLETISVGAIAVLSLLYAAFVFELIALPRHPFTHLGVYFLGLFYISLPIILLFEMAGLTQPQYAPMRVLGIISMVWINDTVAYFVGSKWGRHKLFAAISPKKTWEGTLGGIVGTMGLAALYSVKLPQFTPAAWWSIGVVVSVTATLGDLVESMLKRSVGVKDSGHILPGHGGWLDRFDAFLFVLPWIWMILWCIGKNGT